MMMSSKTKCGRCGERAETIDNIRGTTFCGLVQRTEETIVRTSLRVAATQYTRTRDDSRVLRSDEEIRLCDPCWGLFVGMFLQGREVVALDHEHKWQQGSKSYDGIFLDSCPLCYQTRVSERVE